MIERARKKLRKALRGARRPVVLSSFGKDSVLLLALAREVRPEVDVLWYKAAADSPARRFAESVIKEWGLTTYGYAPADRYYLPAGRGLALVDEYSVGGARLPVITDVGEGEACGLELSPARTPHFGYPWDVSLVGWKEFDSHPVTGPNPFPPDGARVGPTRVYAPLREMTDGEVLDAARAMGLPLYDGPDVLPACTRCVTGEGTVFCPKERRPIESAAWDKAGALRAFRERFPAPSGT